MSRKQEGQQPRHALRQRRIEEGLSQEQLAQAVGIATQTYGEWERGVATPRAPGHRAYLARALRTTNAEMRHLIDGDDHSDLPGGVVPTWLDHLAALEQGASRLWTWEPIVVPGLLQTADYATVVESVTDETVSVADMHRRVRARLARQAVLNREPSPLDLSIIIDESVLHRIAGTAAIQAAQLDHLADAAQEPNIELRVLPLGSGSFAAAFGTFTLLASPQWEDPYMAVVADRAGYHYHDRHHDLAVHKRLFEHLRNVALSPSDTLDFVRHARKALT
jgi:transcriptional regulator with XRE-family HTH domain